MTNVCFWKQNYSTSEHADNAQLAVLCKIITEEEEGGGGEVALLCHFQIHNSALLYLLLLFFLNKYWSSGHSFSCVLSSKMLWQNTTLMKVLLPVCMLITSIVIWHTYLKNISQEHGPIILFSPPFYPNGKWNWYILGP